MTIGSTVGSYIPYSWGEVSIVSFSGLVCGSIGAILGILYGYKKTHPKAVTMATQINDPDDDII